MALISDHRTGILRTLIVALTIGFCSISMVNHAAAKSTLPLFDLANLKGVDTVIVGGSIVPEHRLLPEHSYSLTPEEVKNPPPSPIFLVVKDIFSKQRWISVKMARDVSIEERSKPNTLYLSYAVSAQQEVLDGKAIKVGSLALQLRKYGPGGAKSAIPILPATYPFLIPDTEDEFNKRVAAGVRYLTSYLPSYFVCANKDAYPSKECPDCKVGACRPEHPFKEKIRAKCPPPVKGQLVPIPCGVPYE